MKREITTAAMIAAIAGLATADVQHGTLVVVENDSGNTAASVTVTRAAAAPMGGSYTLPAALHSRGDFYVDFGGGAADLSAGVLLSSIFEDERTEPSVDGGANPYLATSHVARDNTNGYFLPVNRTPQGTEVNANVAFAYFPVADGWRAAMGYIASGANGAALDAVTGNATLITIFDPIVPGNDYIIDALSGQFGIILDGLDIRRDGVLLAVGAKNEDNFAQVRVNFDGRALINIKDNGDDDGGSEQDPLAYAYITDGTPGVVMGRVTGSGRLLYSQGNPEVSMIGQPDLNGQFRIAIPGHSPNTGTLLVTPHTELGGGTVDNPAFAYPDGSTWVVTTRDIEPTTINLQDLSSADVAFHFAFFPFDTAITPGTPAQDYVDRLDDVVAARFEVTEFSPDNGNGDMRADRVAGSDALFVYGDNRGDVGIGWLDARMAARLDNNQDVTDALPDGAPDGLAFGLCSEFVRFNDATGGAAGVGTFSFDNSEARTHVADPLGGEMNINFGVAFFPTAAGFQMEADKQDVPDGQLTVDIGADALSSGVVFGMNWDNNNRVATVDTVGNTFVIQGWNAETGEALISADNFDVGYVYLPFDAENLVAGHVAANGDVLAGTTTEGPGNNFSVAIGTDAFLGSPIFEITIPGVNAANDGGVILANAADGPVVCAWEAGENGEFEIGLYDTDGGFPLLADFSFAYIPAEGLALPATNPGCNAADLAEPFGILDLADISFFIAAFTTQNPAVDYDGNGIFDLTDIVTFTSAFTAGCP